jgi:exonuclease 3'-5' domain-containing protein 1
VLQRARVVQSVQEANNLMVEILKCKPCAVAFDCEGINLGARGQLTLMQLATMNGNAYVFDLLTCPALLNEGGLHSLLESSDIVKVNFLLFWVSIVFRSSVRVLQYLARRPLYLK